MSLTKLSLAGKIKLLPARESLVSDIPAGDGKTGHVFYSVAAWHPQNVYVYSFKKNTFIFRPRPYAQTSASGPLPVSRHQAGFYSHHAKPNICHFLFTNLSSSL
jgi:hypothetical protein